MSSDRGLFDVTEAAAYLAMSPASFSALVAAGSIKPPLRPFAAIQKPNAKGLGDGRWDERDLIEFRDQLMAERDALVSRARAIVTGAPARRATRSSRGACSDQASPGSDAA
jgi:hypothetical protein